MLNLCGVVQIQTLVPCDQISCMCVACPPVLSRELADGCADYITVLTLQHDIVARASLANVEDLRLEVMQSGFWDNFPERKTVVMKHIAHTLQVCKHSPTDCAEAKLR